MKIVSAILFVCAALVSGCGKKESAPQQVSTDSILSTPLDPDATPPPVVVADSFKRFVDIRRIRTPEHMATIKRFSPVELVRIYHKFRPLRKEGITSESQEVKQFLAEQKVTLAELKAILEEGDRLGWSKSR